ncbi:MAG: DUF2480 family protein [Sphingobacterium sp.]|jgi:hypothetical protein|nr:DUF2480 family protein [Sphingobacterium sp.]
MEEEVFFNKVHASGIITVDLMDYESQEEVVFLDIKDFLFMALIIKEKEFKEELSRYDWAALSDRVVAIGCSEDTIIPTWVYFMLADKLHGIAKRVDYRTVEEVKNLLWREELVRAEFTHLEGAKVVVKANPKIDPDLFMVVVDKLRPVVATLMYGEAGMPKVIFKR